MNFRRMRPGDMAAVMRHCRAQNRRDGTSYGVPPVFAADGSPRQNVALALVAVDERGRVRSAYIFERTLEMMAFGGGRGVTEAVVAEAPAIFYALRELGYADFHVQVPKTHLAQLEETMVQHLGTARDDDRLAHFYRTL